MRMPGTAPALRPPRRAELLVDNKAFVALAGELLHAFRNTDDAACAICGIKQGEQHRAKAVCRQLVEWRAHSQYKKANT